MSAGRPVAARNHRRCPYKTRRNSAPLDKRRGIVDSLSNGTRVVPPMATCENEDGCPWFCWVAVLGTGRTRMGKVVKPGIGYRIPHRTRWVIPSHDLFLGVHRRNNACCHGSAERKGEFWVAVQCSAFAPTSTKGELPGRNVTSIDESPVSTTGWDEEVVI